MSSKEQITRLASLAGITINGNKPYDIQVHNEKFYQRVLSQGSLGLGESYMDAWWDAEQLDETFHKFLGANLDKKIISSRIIFEILKAKFLNMQSLTRSKKVAEEHYDLGNDFYEHMLGKRMQYTCGYWKKAKTLEKAQEDKLDLICKKLQLKKGETVLELGSGWGQFAKFAAERYGVEVTSYNISKEQVKYSKEKAGNLPIIFLEQDYRTATGTFDKVVSIGMCEHVGYKNYKTFFEIMHRCLKPNGLCLVHTIGKDISVRTTDPWIAKYIFPNSMLPSVKQLSTAAEGLFVLEDWHNLDTDYDKTLMEWYHNFEKNWSKFKEQYGERFYRMWKYYLLSCAGLFRARRGQLWQIVFSKDGLPGGYRSLR